MNENNSKKGRKIHEEWKKIIRRKVERDTKSERRQKKRKNERKWRKTGKKKEKDTMNERK